MEHKYLMDTNTVIDFLGNKIPENGAAFLDFVSPVISVVTRMEVLGWFNASPKQIAKLQSYLALAYIYPLEEEIVLKTILLRQLHHIKLPDAIIAATAIVYGLTLISRNAKDFKDIQSLSFIDPHNL